MQFLHERGFNETLEALSRETKHEMNLEGGGGQLCSILAEYEEMKLMEVAQEVAAFVSSNLSFCGLMPLAHRWMRRWLRWSSSCAALQLMVPTSRRLQLRYTRSVLRRHVMRQPSHVM
jgi:hypothetical protein